LANIFNRIYSLHSHSYIDSTVGKLYYRRVI